MNNLGEPLTTDNQVAAYLSLMVKRADLLCLTPGQTFGDDQWLVGESKGGDMDDAYYQLEATAEALWNKTVTGATPANTNLRVYVRPTQFKVIRESPSRRGGYFIESGYLSAINEHTQQIELLTGIGG